MFPCMLSQIFFWEKAIIETVKGVLLEHHWNTSCFCERKNRKTELLELAYAALEVTVHRVVAPVILITVCLKTDSFRGSLIKAGLV
jgi:hypothetical protein